MPYRFAPLTVSLISILALTACGGGGGGDGAAPTPLPAPVPATGLTFAECVRAPASGVVNTYLNAARERREWKAGTFLGETVNGRYEYADATSATPVRVRYSKTDPATGIVSTLGQENFDPAGALVSRVQYIGRAFPGTLLAGQSDNVTYTVRTLFPAGVADRTERLTRNYTGNQTAFIALGQVEVCAVTETLANINAGVTTEQYSEQLLYAKGLSWVKSYLKTTAPGSSDLGRTYLTELASTTAPLTLPAPTATSTPTLASCLALPTGQNLTFTASTDAQANQSRRQTLASTFNGAPSTAVRRSNHLGALSEIRHFSPAQGQPQELGREIFLPSASTRSYAGIPDLRNTAIGQTVNFTTLSTQLSPLPSVALPSSNDSFRFEGHQKVTTPAGTFDTCKINRTYGNGLQETYYYAADLHWVRLESTSTGVKTTIELIER